MIEKKGWLKNAEARTNGFYINGKKEKGARLTQAEVDAWNGVKAKAKPAPAPVVEEAPIEEAPVEEAAVEEKPKTFFKKKKSKK